MRPLNRIAFCLAAALFGAVPALGDGAESRIHVAGERLATFEFALRLDDVDPRRPETLARAKVETDEALVEMVERGFGLLLIGELCTAYEGRFDEEALREWRREVREEETRAELAAAARTRRETEVGAARPTAGGREFPVVVTARREGEQDVRRHYRVRLTGPADGPWVVAETLAACAACNGFAWTAVDRKCTLCQGNAWRQVPTWNLAEARAVEAMRPLPAPHDEGEAAEQVLTVRHRRSLEVLARFVERVEPAHAAYVRTFFGAGRKVADLRTPLPQRSYRFVAESVGDGTERGFRRVEVNEVVTWQDGLVGSRALTVMVRAGRAGPRVVGIGVSCGECKDSGKCAACGGRTGEVDPGSATECRRCAGKGICLACGGRGPAPVNPFSPHY